MIKINNEKIFYSFHTVFNSFEKCLRCHKEKVKTSILYLINNIVTYDSLKTSTQQHKTLQKQQTLPEI